MDGCKIIFDNTSDRLKSYSISLAYLLFFTWRMIAYKNSPWCSVIETRLCHPQFRDTGSDWSYENWKSEVSFTLINKNKKVIEW